MTTKKITDNMRIKSLKQELSDAKRKIREQTESLSILDKELREEQDESHHLRTRLNKAILKRNYWMEFAFNQVNKMANQQVEVYMDHQGGHHPASDVEGDDEYPEGIINHNNHKHGDYS